MKLMLFFIVILIVSLCMYGILVFTYIYRSFEMPYYLFSFIIMIIITVILYTSYRKMIDKDKRMQQRYNDLSENEKQEVEEELAYQDNWKGFYFGKHFCYFYYGCFIGFLKYKDIAWLFWNKTDIGNVQTIADISFVNTTHTYTIHLYTHEGELFKVPCDQNWSQEFEILQDKVPDAIIGYTKKRMKYAKKDFSLFLTTYQDIDKNHESHS